MSSLVRVGKSLRRLIGGGLAVLVLLAVPALGLAHLGSDLLASWQQGRDAEQAATTPWTLDAPASTLARLDGGAQESLAASDRAELPGDALLLEQWQSTSWNKNHGDWDWSKKDFYWYCWFLRCHPRPVSPCH